MSSSGISATNSGPLAIRTYTSGPNKTFILSDYDVPVPSNYVLITSSNGLLVPTDSPSLASISVSTLNVLNISFNNLNISTISTNRINMNNGYINSQNGLTVNGNLNISSNTGTDANTGITLFNDKASIITNSVYDGMYLEASDNRPIYLCNTNNVITYASFSPNSMVLGNSTILSMPYGSITGISSITPINNNLNINNNVTIGNSLSVPSFSTNTISTSILTGNITVGTSLSVPSFSTNIISTNLINMVNGSITGISSITPTNNILNINGKIVPSDATILYNSTITTGGDYIISNLINNSFVTGNVIVNILAIGGGGGGAAGFLSGGFGFGGGGGGSGQEVSASYILPVNTQIKITIGIGGSSGIYQSGETPPVSVGGNGGSTIVETYNTSTIGIITYGGIGGGSNITNIDYGGNGYYGGGCGGFYNTVSEEGTPGNSYVYYYPPYNRTGGLRNSGGVAGNGDAPAGVGGFGGNLGSSTLISGGAGGGYSQLTQFDRTGGNYNNVYYGYGGYYTNNQNNIISTGQSSIYGGGGGGGSWNGNFSIGYDGGTGGSGCVRIQILV